MQIGTRFHEAICFLALDAFAPVRQAMVAQPGHLQDLSINMLRAPNLPDESVTTELARYPLTFAPFHLGGLMHHWYATLLPPELAALFNIVFPFDSEARQNHARFREIFAKPAELDTALMHYAKAESALFAAFAIVEATFVSNDVTDRDIAIIQANLRFDLNRAATHPFQMALMRYLRARIICDYFAATRVQQSQVKRFAQETGLPINQNHLEGLWARVH
jgi:hypothetical protein